MRAVGCFGNAAAHIGVHAGEAVNEAVRHQEFERAVDGDRGGAAALGVEAIKDVVGADRGVALPDERENALANLREAGAPSGADVLGL